eukprot:308317_1
MALNINKVEQMPINSMDILTTFQIGKSYYCKQNIMGKQSKTKLIPLVLHIYWTTISCIIFYCDSLNKKHKVLLTPIITPTKHVIYVSSKRILKIFIVSTVMILIFEAFNFSDKYSMKYFQTFSKKQNVIIVEETLSFLTTFGLLLKQKGEKQNEIYWSINEDFEYPMNRINLYHMFEVYKYNKSVPQFNERLQRHIVDACIVRTMKKRRSMSALELIKHIQKETSTMFRATDEFIKNRIKNLVELEYLEIDRSHYEPWYAYKL